MDNKEDTYGYRLISISSGVLLPALRSNGERAFVVSQLQDLLSPRLILGDVPSYRQLASCVDLLAFSLRQNAIQLLIFTVDTTIAADFAHRITARLSQYRSDICLQPRAGTDWHIIIDKLAGQHEALHASVQLHTAHEDWEYDRYSSIGFYLHDRRGDWMRTWRLAALFNQDPELYRELLKDALLYRRAATPAEPLAS